MSETVNELVLPESRKLIRFLSELGNEEVINVQSLLLLLLQLPPLPVLLRRKYFRFPTAPIFH